MLSNLKKGMFPFLIAFSALSVSCQRLIKIICHGDTEVTERSKALWPVSVISVARVREANGWCAFWFKIQRAVSAGRQADRSLP